jgi:murein DD-endopeptidase MepM/ murein hydrolase activator NlpD
MPTVPETFAPSVSQGETPMVPATGPWVSPMKNSAPSLLVQTGDTLARTGAQATQLGNTIVDAAQQTTDSARIKAAETQFLKSAQGILYNPQGGYLNTRGMNAQDQFGGTLKALDKAASDANDTLTNPVQKQAFALSLNDHVRSINTQLWNHQHEQVTQYGIQQNQDHADAMIIQARDAFLNGREADYLKAADSAAADVQKVAELQSGAPADSDIARGMWRAKRTDLVQGVTMGLLQTHQVDQAKEYLERERGNIDMRAAEALGNLVKSEYDRNLTETKGDGFLAAAAQGGHSDQFMAVPNPKGMVASGNLPIWNRPIVKNADGTTSSEYSTSFEDEQGHEVLVPTVVNGKFLTPDGKKPEEGSAAEKAMFQEAWDHYLKTGENLGKFDNSDNADAYAEQLHSRDASSPTLSVPYTYGPLATGSTINPMKITDVPGSPRPNGRIHDGYDIKMPAGTAVTAPLDGKVVKVWNDDKFDGGLSMRVQLADGNTLGIAHLSYANLQEGDKVNRGQVIALSGKTGNATGPVLHVALMDPEGKFIDYFSASKAQPDRAGIANPDVLDRAIDMAKNDDSLDPFQQRQIVRYMKSEHTNERVIQSQQYQDAKMRAVDWMAQNGNDYASMPVNLKAPLRPSDAQGFQEMQDEDKLAKSDLDTQVRYWSMPPEQRTPTFVKGNYQNLKQGTFMSLLKNATELQQNADNLPEAKVQDTMFRSALLENNFTNLVAPKSDGDKQQLLQLRANVDDVATSMQAALGRKLRPDEWQNVLNSQLKNSVFVEHARTVPFAFLGKMALSALPGGGVQLPVTQDDLHYGKPAQLGSVAPADLGKTYVMSAGRKVYGADIPPGLRLQYELNRFKRGLPITEQGVADDWVHFGMPKQ